MSAKPSGRTSRPPQHPGVPKAERRWYPRWNPPRGEDSSLPIDLDAGLAHPPALVGRLKPRTQPLLQVKRVPDATIIAGSTQRSFEDAGPDFFHFFTLQIGRRRKSQLCHFSGAKVFRVTERFQIEFRGSFF